MMLISQTEMYTISRKRGATFFLTITLAFLGLFFYNFCTYGNRNEYSKFTFNLLA